MQEMHDRILAIEMKSAQYLNNQSMKRAQFDDLLEMDDICEKRALLALQMKVDCLKSTYSSQR